MLLLASLPGGAAAQGGDSPAQIDPRAMSMAEIRAHNATLDRKNKNYIVCRTSEHTGSLARKNRTCRTNGEWEQAARAAQEWMTAISDKARAMPYQ